MESNQEEQETKQTLPTKRSMGYGVYYAFKCRINGMEEETYPKEHQRNVDTARPLIDKSLTPNSLPAKKKPKLFASYDRVTVFDGKPVVPPGKDQAANSRIIWYKDVQELYKLSGFDTSIVVLSENSLTGEQTYTAFAFVTERERDEAFNLLLKHAKVDFRNKYSNTRYQSAYIVGGDQSVYGNSIRQNNYSSRRIYETSGGGVYGEVDIVNDILDVSDLDSSEWDEMYEVRLLAHQDLSAASNSSGEELLSVILECQIKRLYTGFQIKCYDSSMLLRPMDPDVSDLMRPIIIYDDIEKVYVFDRNDMFAPVLTMLISPKDTQEPYSMSAQFPMSDDMQMFLEKVKSKNPNLYTIEDVDYENDSQDGNNGVRHARSTSRYRTSKYGSNDNLRSTTENGRMEYGNEVDNWSGSSREGSPRTSSYRH